LLRDIHPSLKRRDLEVTMPVKQGDLSLLQHPAAKELLQSKIPARLAYVWMDGTPRVIPIWFHWKRKRVRDGNADKSVEAQGIGEEP
jgi:hypothetical protein